MPLIRNSSLFKRFTDFFKLKTNDFLDSEAGRMLVPVINLPLPPNIIEISDTVANNSDKVITVPAGKQWKILYGHIVFSTSANAGNRRIEINIRNAADDRLYEIGALNVQVASTSENYVLGQYGDTGESFAATHTLPIPINLILSGTFDIRVFDNAAIDAAADDMDIRLIVEETDITGE